MKTLTTILSSILCIGFTTAFCQNAERAAATDHQKKKLKITDESVSLGGAIQQMPYGTLSDFQKLCPQSALLDHKMTGYSSSSGFGAIFSPVFNANLGMSKSSVKDPDIKAVTQFRLGVSMTGISFNNYLRKTDRVPYDTLTSSQTGQATYSDSITHHGYSMNYRSHEIRIDLSVIYRTNPAARWSLYGGIGVEAGKSLNSYTTVHYNEYSYIQSSGNNSNSERDVNESERFINKNGYSCAAYLPMGIDFRVGRKREFFKQLHFFYEVRPYVSYINVPELGSMTGPGLRSSCGLRVTI